MNENNQSGRSREFVSPTKMARPTTVEIRRRASSPEASRAWKGRPMSSVTSSSQSWSRRNPDSARGKSNNLKFKANLVSNWNWTFGKDLDFTFLGTVKKVFGCNFSLTSLGLDIAIHWHFSRSHWPLLQSAMDIKWPTGIIEEIYLKYPIYVATQWLNCISLVDCSKVEWAIQQPRMLVWFLVPVKSSTSK